MDEPVSAASSDMSVPAGALGITATIPAVGGIISAWRIYFECLSNPLWFPLACLCLLPLLAFFLLKKETIITTEKRGDKEKLMEEAGIFHDRRREAGLKRRLIGGIFVLYYALFVYDLFMFGKSLDGLSGEEEEGGESLTFTHSSLSPSEGTLRLVYAFRHWTRPLAAVLRAAVVAGCWRIEDRLRVVNV